MTGRHLHWVKLLSYWWGLCWGPASFSRLSWGPAQVQLEGVLQQTPVPFHALTQRMTWATHITNLDSGLSFLKGFFYVVLDSEAFSKRKGFPSEQPDIETPNEELWRQSDD